MPNFPALPDLDTLHDLDDGGTCWCGPVRSTVHGCDGWLHIEATFAVERAVQNLYTLLANASSS